jgi:FKBP-type peptidyl-prolyl cis-trans isomerase 2
LPPSQLQFQHSNIEEICRILLRIYNLQVFAQLFWAAFDDLTEKNAGMTISPSQQVRWYVSQGQRLQEKGEDMSENSGSKTVRVHYTGTLADGTVFDSSRERDPFEFAVGTGQVIKGFDDAVADMAVGDTKTVTVPSDDAYGPHFAERVIEVDHGQFAEGVIPEVGMQLQSDGGEGQQTMVVTVTEVTEDKVILDANHPLAGQDLTFEIELMELV